MIVWNVKLGIYIVVILVLMHVLHKHIFQLVVVIRVIRSAIPVLVRSTRNVLTVQLRIIFKAQCVLLLVQPACFQIFLRGLVWSANIIVNLVPVLPLVISAILAINKLGMHVSEVTTSIQHQL